MNSMKYICRLKLQPTSYFHIILRCASVSEFVSSTQSLRVATSSVKDLVYFDLDSDPLCKITKSGSCGVLQLIIHVY